MDFRFDLQLFGGSSSTTTNTSTYTPSEYELQLQKAQADYANATAPNALWLNNKARDLLQDSLGVVQVDYNDQNQKAQNQISNAQNGIAGLASNLSNTPNPDYSGIISGNSGANTTANSYLSGIASLNNGAASTANAGLSSLASGNLPAAYQKNMEDSIRTGLNNTIGSTVNSLGNRGVLNSSVTSKAMDDIEGNAANALASQYSNNISQLSNLYNNQFSNSMNANSANANLANSQLSNTLNTNSANAGLTGQGFSDTLSKTSALSGLYGNQINNATAGTTAAAAAQEAAQTPAINLWNASLGLNGSTTGALAAAAGKGTTTNTQSTSSGGGGGLFSGLISGLASGYQWCFPAGTKISMADGSKKNIEDIKAGDKVETIASRSEDVIETMPEHYNDVLTIETESDITHTTATQPLMMKDGEYIIAGAIVPGVSLMRTGKVIKVTPYGRHRVYDLHVSGDNTYIADNFIAQGGNGSWPEE